MNVVELRPNHNCLDIVKGLRAIADDIEAGAYGFEPELAAIVLGFDQQKLERDGVAVRYGWQTHGLGEKATAFTTRGLLASALNDFNGDSK